MQRKESKSGKRFRTIGLCLLAAFTMGAIAAAPASATFHGAAAWGYNGVGELGDGTFTGPETCYPGNPVAERACSTTPVSVSGLGEVSAISVGGLHSLALRSNGTVMAWGANEFGQLGDGTEAPSDVPVAVNGLSGVTAISTGFNHSLALLSNGTVMAWGWNAYGQLGNGTTTYNSNVPVAVSGLSGVVAISASGGGGEHSLALLSNGTVMAWGDNSNGQLGNGTTTGLETCYQGNFSYPSCSRTPVPVSGLGEVSAITAGGIHSLALLRNGTVMAWGYDGYGQLGNGNAGYEEQSDVPVPVSGLGEVSAISAGGEHSLALLRNGTVMAWGFNNYGQLGIGSPLPTYSDVPLAVSGLTGVTAISTGFNDSLALLSNGKVMAWGGNEYGSLGTGDWGARYAPVAVSGLSEVSAISAGYVDTLAIAHTATPTTAHSTPSGTIVVGQSETDTLLVTGDTELGAPTGGTRFFVCAKGTSPCASGGTQVGGTVGLSAGGGHESSATSAAFTPSEGTGTYCLRAEYEGDSNYSAGSDATSDECFTVVRARCTGNSGTITLSPGLTHTPAVQTMKIKGTFTGCSGEPFTKTKYTATLKTADLVSCSVLNAAGEQATGVAKYAWTPKAKASKGTLTMLLTETPGVSVVGGVTSGSYAPRTLSGTVTESYTGAATCSVKRVKKGTFRGSAVSFE
jgi:alpha-tubulin suppressor-like RCC1 family protein